MVLRAQIVHMWRVLRANQGNAEAREGKAPGDPVPLGGDAENANEDDDEDPLAAMLREVMERGDELGEIPDEGQHLELG